MLINLTVHPVVLHTGDGTTIEITPDPRGPARVGREYEDVASDGVPIRHYRPSAVTGLPEPEEGVVYIVSALVAGAVNRPDVVHPDDYVRDDNGRIIGARALARPAID